MDYLIIGRASWYGIHMAICVKKGFFYATLPVILGV